MADFSISLGKEQMWFLFLLFLVKLLVIEGFLVIERNFHYNRLKGGYRYRSILLYHSFSCEFPQWRSGYGFCFESITYKYKVTQKSIKCHFKVTSLLLQICSLSSHIHFPANNTIQKYNLLKQAGKDIAKSMRNFQVFCIYYIPLEIPGVKPTDLKSFLLFIINLSDELI